jgi:hypothetical protein
MAIRMELIDPTEVAVNDGHFACKGQCPRCKVLWSKRPDCSCDCFSLGSQGRVPIAWQVRARRVIMEVVRKELNS